MLVTELIEEGEDCCRSLLVPGGPPSVSCSDDAPDETLPRDTEIVLGPDARPSDYPEAETWHDTPPPDSSEPCCRLTSPAYRQTSEGEQGGPTDVAWNGSGWGILWSAEPQALKFHPLSSAVRGATDLGSLQVLAPDVLGFRSWTVGLVHGDNLPVSGVPACTNNR